MALPWKVNSFVVTSRNKGDEMGTVDRGVNPIVQKRPIVLQRKKLMDKYRKPNGYHSNSNRNRSKRGGSIVSVKTREDVKKVEEVEDCFILEFDPTQLNNHDDDISDSIVCVKKKEDVKKYEELEDCFILDFDPFVDQNSMNFKFNKLSVSVSVKTEVFTDDDDDDDVSILGVKGQVACRDYPHPRHLCGMHPFKTTTHEVHCKMCYCYVCDSTAPCKKWTRGCKDPNLKHCDATPDIPCWRRRRDRKKEIKKLREGEQ